MSWLKRNLFLLLGAVVALALLGVAGFYFFAKKQQADGVAGELEEQIKTLQALLLRDPFPNADNIEAVKREAKRVTELLGEYRKHFEPTAYYTNMDSGTFKELLETTLRSVQKGAEAAGVSLPTKSFSATFQSQRGTLVFTQSDLVPLAHQVADIGAICDLLFKARVHALLSLRRVPVSRSDQGSTEFLIGRRAETNVAIGAVITPYDVTFQGFSGELAAVLEAFHRSPHCFVVKNINVERMTPGGAAEGDSEGSVAYGVPGSPAAAGAPQSAADAMRARYGTGPSGAGAAADLMRRRYGVNPRGVPSPTPAAPVTPFAPAAPAAPVRKGPETVLDEKPLKFTLFIESVKLLPSATAR
jgi:hypothetical protein